MAGTVLHPDLTAVLSFLQRHPGARQAIAAPPDKTVVYSGGTPGPAGVLAAWQQLAQAKAQDPQRFDYVTLEERLRLLHAPVFGESLYDRARRVAEALQQQGLGDQAMVLWRALSGLYVQGARGKVRALVLPGPGVAGSVFALTEVHVLLRADVQRQIEIDPSALRDFRTTVRVGNQPAPLVVM